MNNSLLARLFWETLYIKLSFLRNKLCFLRKISYPDWRTGEEITCELSDALIGYHSHALVDTVGLLNKHLTTPLIYVVVWKEASKQTNKQTNNLHVPLVYTSINKYLCSCIYWFIFLFAMKESKFVIHCEDEDWQTYYVNMNIIIWI